MAKEYRLQDPGEGIHEAEIVDISVREGQEVREGDPLMAVETDKAVVDIPSPFTGQVQSLRVKAGDIAEVGDVLLTYSEEGAREPETKNEEEEPAPPRGEPAPKAAEGEGEHAPVEKPAKEESAAKKPEEKTPEAAEVIPASPATRRLARELGVDLAKARASGPHGRVTAEDLRGLSESGGPGAEKEEPEHPVEEGHGRDEFGPTEIIPLRSIRRVTAQRTEAAWRQIPHVMHFDLADVTDLEDFRRRHQGRAEERGGKLTVTVLAVKAAVAALKRFPRFNASIDPEAGEIAVKKYYNIGVAVATDQGLLVPVLKDADRKGVIELAAELTELAERTRRGEASREELSGGTFTITNTGGIGGRLFTPIINLPEAAILGLAQSRLQQVVLGDPERPRTAIRLLLPLCLSFDHRINDGADAANFMNVLTGLLGNPEELLLA